MHSPPQLLLDLPERCPHAIAPCDPLYDGLPMVVAFTNEGKAEKVEGLRLSEPTLSASVRRKAAELDQAGLIRIERQRSAPSRGARTARMTFTPRRASVSRRRGRRAGPTAARRATAPPLRSAPPPRLSALPRRAAVAPALSPAGRSPPAALAGGGRRRPRHGLDAGRERGDGGSYGRIAVGPIDPAAGQEPHTSGITARQQSEAVQLYLVNPSRPGWGLWRWAGEAGFDEAVRKDNPDAMTGLVPFPLARTLQRGCKEQGTWQSRNRRRFPSPRARPSRRGRNQAPRCYARRWHSQS
jgi:hypothetical protein